MMQQPVLRKPCSPRAAWMASRPQCPSLRRASSVCQAMPRDNVPMMKVGAVSLSAHECRQRGLGTPGVQQPEQQQATDRSRRALLATVIGAGAAAVGVAQKAEATEAFLSSSGVKGPLAAEEEYYFNLRREKEGEARRELQEKRETLEAEGRTTSEGKLCATPFGVDVVGITELVCLIGALVGGISARQRKMEMERLNEQLRKINLQLRQQARSGVVYAPGLNYSPPSSPSVPDAPAADNEARQPEEANGSVLTAALAAGTAAASTMSREEATARTLSSMEDALMTEDQLQCRDALREGKKLLKVSGSSAMVRFEKALLLSKAISDRTSERRAMRGLAAAACMQGQSRTAIRHLERVLAISKEMGEYTGDGDAYGTIADIYTEMGEFEAAATYYDMYIARMMEDGTVV